MSKLSIKLIILLMACLCMFMMASCAFASDADGMNNVTAIDDANSNDALEIPVQQTSVENANGNPDVGTFIELDQEMKNLKPGEIYWFDKDYTFDEKTDNSSRTIDIAADNVVIDGRTHTIDASGASGVTFKVTGNNIYIKNLKFNNFHGQTGESVSSPIQWSGNNGTCDYCDFNNNVGVNGGAVSWSGDNGAGGGHPLKNENGVYTATVSSGSTWYAPQFMSETFAMAADVEYILKADFQLDGPSNQTVKYIVQEAGGSWHIFTGPTAITWDPAAADEDGFCHYEYRFTSNAAMDTVHVIFGLGDSEASGVQFSFRNVTLDMAGAENPAGGSGGDEWTPLP